MEVRIDCPCEQSYVFEVEPVNGRMPVPVICPACGGDGTTLANDFISQRIPGSPAPPPVSPIPIAPATASHAAVRVNRPPSAPPVPAPPAAPTRTAPRAMVSALPKPSKQIVNSMALGIVGALLGAALGSGLLFGLSIAIGFKFPLFGTITGILSGLGARMLYRGTDSSLGAVAAVISIVATTGTLYLMFGEFAIFNIVSIIVSASMAWRIAS